MKYGKDKNKDKNLVKPPIKRTPTKKMGTATKPKKRNDNEPFIRGESAGMTVGQARAMIKKKKAIGMERKDVRSAIAKAGVNRSKKK